MNKYRHNNQQVVLKRDLRKVTIDKVSLDGDHYLVSYFTEYNKISYEVITESDILTEEEYIKIKKRADNIDKLFR
jgi:hypothetical protein